jgi:hypothetical protein
LHRRGAGDDAENLRIQAPQFCNHLLGQTIAEVLLALAFTQAFEGQDGQH